MNNVANQNTIHGIDLNDSDRNHIDQNVFSNNMEYGIYMRDDSDGNTYGRNTLRGNDGDTFVCTPDPPGTGSPCGAPDVCDETPFDPDTDADANRSFGDNLTNDPGSC